MTLKRAQSGLARRLKARAEPCRGAFTGYRLCRRPLPEFDETMCRILEARHVSGGQGVSVTEAPAVAPLELRNPRPWGSVK